MKQSKTSMLKNKYQMHPKEREKEKQGKRKKERRKDRKYYFFLFFFGILFNFLNRGRITQP